MDWINFGWNSDYTGDFDKTKNFNVGFERLINSDKPVQTIANRVIEDITKKYPAPYTLMLSGGVDSQSMLWLWMNSGVPFNAVSVKYMSPDRSIWFNEHDLQVLHTFSKKHNIPIEYMEFDIIDFLENRLLDYVLKYQCNSPQICTHMAISELMSNGTVLFSGNFKFHTSYTYTIWGLKRYADTIDRSVIPFFLLHDAELAGAIVRSRNITPTERDQEAYLKKVNSLQNIGIPVIPQSQKFNGFEKIKEYYDQFDDRVTVQDRIKYSRRPSKRVFDILFRYRVGDKIPYQDRVIYH